MKAVFTDQEGGAAEPPVERPDPGSRLYEALFLKDPVGGEEHLSVDVANASRGSQRRV